MGLFGNWRQIVFYGRRLSSLSSISATDEAPATLRSWVEVDLAAIRRNAATLAAIVGPSVKIMAVAKANAYGHGAPAVVGALAGEVAMFGVANLAEAEEISSSAKGTPICLLSGTLPAEHAAIVRRGFIPIVSSAEEAAQYAAHASGARVKVHLAVDTGMGRLGIWEDDAIETARKIIALPGIEITGIASHLPVADEDTAFTREQLTRFHALAARLRDTGLRDALVHVENSAALLAFPNLAGALVRPGLALYGESPLPEFQPRLERALLWKTRVVLVRDFGKGRSVSYGRDFITPAPMRIATLAVGYADGYPRQLSGKNAAVLIGGKRCAILGRVTMDQIMVDATATDAAPGAEAVLIGTQGGEAIRAGELAKLAGTIVWDIFTGIGPRVARLHRDGDSSASSISTAPIPA
jgi:alanine racemase